MPDVLILEPTVFRDDRGFFYESFNQKQFIELTGVTRDFVQDNHSKAAKGMLRGLHYQLRQPQGKLVRVTSGELFDVPVALRKSSPTFGHWVGVHLSASNKRQVCIQKGFAYGLVVLSNSVEFLYKTTEYWAPEFERSLLWNDPAIGINWPLDGAPLLTVKDQVGTLLTNADIFA